MSTNYIAGFYILSRRVNMFGDTQVIRSAERKKNTVRTNRELKKKFRIRFIFTAFFLTAYFLSTAPRSAFEIQSRAGDVRI